MYERHPVNAKMNITPTAIKPFEIIHMDAYTFEQSKFLIIIHSFSKYAQAYYYLNSISGTEIADNILHVLNSFWTSPIRMK
nr:unnamed protein product [Callosobruchus chinensis]